MLTQDKKVPFYYLKSCDTCARILKKIPTDHLCLINIKETPVTETQLEQLRKLSGSYEALFNFRALKLRDLPTESKPKTEEEFKNLLLEDYTYLKRPVAIVDGKLFVGNQPNTIRDLESKLSDLQ